VPTGQAQPQVNPRVADLHAILANMRGCVGNFDFIEMGAFDGHLLLLLQSSDENTTRRLR
jgi:hypothetical protein